MVAVLEKYRLAFFPISKVASTSVKHALGKILDGEHFDDTFSKVHNRWPTDPVQPADFDRFREYTCFTIVRDPIERIISYHHNRLRNVELLRSNPVIYVFRKLSYRLRSLSLDATLEEFILHFERYQKLEPNVRPHICSMSEYIGHDVGYFDLVAKMENLEPVVELIRRVTGHTVSIPVRNRNENLPVAFESLSQKAQRKLIEMTSDDYRLLDGYYTPPHISNAAKLKPEIAS